MRRGHDATELECPEAASTDSPSQMGAELSSPAPPLDEDEEKETSTRDASPSSSASAVDFSTIKNGGFDFAQLATVYKKAETALPLETPTNRTSTITDSASQPSSRRFHISFGGSTTRRVLFGNDEESFSDSTELANLPLVAFPGACPNGVRPRLKAQSTITLYLSDPTAQQTFATSVPKGGNVGVVYNEDVDSASMKRLTSKGFLARLVRTSGGNGATLMARLVVVCDIEIIGAVQRDESGGMVGTAKVRKEVIMASGVSGIVEEKAAVLQLV